MIERIVAKLTSGKWLLTIVAAAVFAYATFANILDGAAVGALLGTVFTAYFNKEKQP